MASWEYKVVPAPTKGRKGKGVKGAEGRFAYALESLMNEMAGDGWEFQRAETLPSIERAGLTGSSTEWRNMLVFRRAVSVPMDDFEPELLPAPSIAAVPPAIAAAPVLSDTADTEGTAKTSNENDDETTNPSFTPGEGATQMLPDNGVEGTSDVAGMTASLKKLASRRGGSDIGPEN